VRLICPVRLPRSFGGATRRVSRPFRNGTSRRRPRRTRVGFRSLRMIAIWITRREAGGGQRGSVDQGARFHPRSLHPHFCRPVFERSRAFGAFSPHVEVSWSVSRASQCRGCRTRQCSSTPAHAGRLELSTKRLQSRRSSATSSVRSGIPRRRYGQYAPRPRRGTLRRSEWRYR
jgi:hypothetical protein